MSVKPGIRRERPTFAEVEICKEWWRIPDDGRKPHVLILEIYRDAHYDILGHNGGIFVADEWPGSWAPCLPPTAVSERDSRQAEVFAWARAAFGESGTTIAQRGIRLLEEAIEAYQAAGCSAKMAHELVDFVFGRPVGDIRQELGGVGVCTLVLAAAAGASADDEEAREVQRVLAKSLDAWRERQLFHRDPGPEATAGRRVVIVGNGEAAVTAALDAVEAGAASVTVVHRRDDFDAPTPLLLRFQSARTNGRIEIVTAQPSGLQSEGEVLKGLVVDGSDDRTRTLALDLLLVLLGWSPKLGPIAQWGLALARKQLIVDTERFETSTRGIHAIGDAVTYPGKQKLIVSGFHEATLAAYAVAERVHPDRAQPLLYTTTSPKLHKLLGVDPANPSPPALP